MPKKPQPGSVRSRAAARPPRKDGRKRQPNQWGGNEFRISFARRHQADGESYSDTRAAIVEHFKVHPTTAEQDIKEAKRREAELDGKDVPAIRRRNTQRYDTIADLAQQAGSYNAAVAALRRIDRIWGVDAPKKIEVSGDVNVIVDIHAMVAVLSDAGRAAYELVLAEVEAAMARGELARPHVAQLTDGDEDNEAN